MKISKTLIKSLDFDKILDYMKDEFKYSVTEEKYENYLFLERYEIDNYLNIISELFRFPLENNFSFLNRVDIREHLRYIEKELVINPEDYLDIALMSDKLRNFNRDIERKAKDGTLVRFKKVLEGLTEDIPVTDKIIYKIIDKNGQIKSNASLKLLDIRKRIHSIETNIRDIIKDYLSRRDLSNFLQEDYYTIRKNRFVLPIKTSFQGTIKGIIHDRSNTGETVYIEPNEVVEQNNKLIIIKEQEKAEIKRILKILSSELKIELPSLYKLIDTYVQLDLINARFLFSQKLNGKFIQITQDFEIDLKSVYNPLMFLENNGLKDDGKVEAIDIKMDNDKDIMIISGPNAGGKTVALKTIGMVSLLLKAGILPPAREDSVFPVFSDLFAIIGDNQSISGHESSFTSHLRELDYGFKKAKKGDIILIDEILQNTDPTAGAALSKGYLEAISEKGVKAIITTHYGDLKYQALQSDRWINASVELNPKTKKPTYKLFYNKMSESLPLTIAQNLNISSIIIEKATKYLAHQENDVNKLIKKLNDKIDYYEDEVYKLNVEKVEIEKFKEEKRKFFLEKSSFMLKREKNLKDEIDQIRKSLKKEIKALKNSSVEKKEKFIKTLDERRIEKQNSINKLEKDLTNSSTTKQIDPKNLEIGQKVYVNNMEKHGTILKISRNRITLQVGNLKMMVKAKELSHPKSKNDIMINKITKKIHAKKDISRVIIDETMIRRKENTLDIIGKTTFDSDPIIDSFLDRLFYQKKQYGFIVHGHGTGKLRNHVRSMLKKHPLVRSFNKAESDDGGNAVTVVMLEI